MKPDGEEAGEEGGSAAGQQRADDDKPAHPGDVQRHLRADQEHHFLQPVQSGRAVRVVGSSERTPRLQGENVEAERLMRTLV